MYLFFIFLAIANWNYIWKSLLVVQVGLEIMELFTLQIFDW